jgi:hypothetical protein
MIRGIQIIMHVSTAHISVSTLHAMLVYLETYNAIFTPWNVNCGGWFTSITVHLLCWWYVTSRYGIEAHTKRLYAVYYRAFNIFIKYKYKPSPTFVLHLLWASYNSNVYPQTTCRTRWMMYVILTSFPMLKRHSLINHVGICISGKFEIVHKT